MNRGLFSSQINESWRILQKLKIEGEREWYPDYQAYPASYYRNLSYADVWLTSFQNHLYDFSFRDNSLIQYNLHNYNPIWFNYSYLECPYNCLPYKEFIEKEVELDYNEVGDELLDDYSTYMVSCGFKDTVTPIRYDYEPQFYKEGTHPASHIHFGHGNNIRVATIKVLRPLSFLLFIIRHCYPDEWQLIHNHKNSQPWFRNIREVLNDVEEEYINLLDSHEMILI